MSTDILTEIDEALAWDGSPDSMRSSPSPFPSLGDTAMDVVARVCAATGLDGYAAWLATADVVHYGRSSPHWDVVAAGLSLTSQPTIDVAPNPLVDIDDERPFGARGSPIAIVIPIDITGFMRDLTEVAAVFRHGHDQPCLGSDKTLAELALTHASGR